MNTPPIAPVRPHRHTNHGDTRIDDYHWLRDRENPEVIAYLEAENAYAEKEMAHLKPLRQKLFDEIVGRIPRRDVSAPYPLCGYLYYRKYDEGKEYAVYCRKPLKGGEEEVLIDGNERAEGHAYHSFGSVEISDDNHLVAFAEDVVSRRIYTVRFKDLRTGELLADELTGTAGSVVWAADHRTVLYTRKDPETLRSYCVYRHVLGTDQSEDEEVFTEEDDTYHVSISRSNSGKYIFIHSHSTMTSEHRIVEAENPGVEPKVFQERTRGLEYEIQHGPDGFYVLHNADGSNFSISKTPENATGRRQWQTVVAHDPGVLLSDMLLFKGFMAVEVRENGLTRIRIYDLKSGGVREVEFSDPTYMAFLATNEEFDTEVLRYGYTSLTTPMSVYDVNMIDGSTTLVKREEVVGGFDPEDYESEYVLVKSRDGVDIPMSIVYPKGFEKNGKSPVLLYGYGAYGLSLDAYFSIPRISLLQRGFAFAIAHVRGGQELGREWYEKGRLEYKTNTFHDFIDCAEHLIRAGYTSPEHLYAMGGSAGGLLMGAVINMKPNLWNGVVAQVPFVDVLTTMLDASIPLTTGEYDEWGNPNEKKAYERIKSYSPIDNLVKGEYPALLVTTGLHDSQVQYWEPAKWVAAMRVLKTNDTPLYLVTNMDTGHGGASGRFERYREVALEYAFLLGREGIGE